MKYSVMVEHIFLLKKVSFSNYKSKQYYQKTAGTYLVVFQTFVQNIFYLEPLPK
jgi:hypothetical protein